MNGVTHHKNALKILCKLITFSSFLPSLFNPNHIILNLIETLENCIFENYDDVFSFSGRIRLLLLNFFIIFSVNIERRMNLASYRNNYI